MISFDSNIKKNNPSLSSFNSFQNNVNNQLENSIHISSISMHILNNCDDIINNKNKESSFKSDISKNINNYEIVEVDYESTRSELSQIKQKLNQSSSQVNYHNNISK
jgi:hypothetical protein